MNQNFTAKEVRAYARKLINVCMPSESMERAADMLNAYADTLSKPADSGRVMDEVVERAEKAERERDFLVEEYERAVKCGKQGYLHAAMHLFNAITNASIDAAMQARVTAALAAQGQGELAGYVDPKQVAEVQKNEVAAVSIGTLSERYGRTVPVYFHPAPAASPAVVPDGYALVPCEPTETMIRIGAIWCRENPVGKATVKNECTAANSYRAMLAAAPQPGEP